MRRPSVADVAVGQSAAGSARTPKVSFLARRRIHSPGVRREKAALFQWVQTPPGNRSSRKQPEQLWR